MSIKSILNKKWIIIIFLLAIFTPAYFDQNVAVKTILNGLKLIVLIVVFLLHFINIKTHSKKPYNIILIILWTELFISTLISPDVSIYVYTTQAIDTLIPCFLIGALAIHSPVNGIKALYYYFSTCVLINTITFILFPGALYADIGGWRCWILGDDNASYSYYVMASTFAMIYCSCVKKRTTFVSVLVWISGFIFSFGREMGNGIICQIIWLVLFMLYHFRGMKKLLKARYIFYATVIGFLGVVVFRNFIIGSVATALGKDITLSGRTQLWDKVIKAVMSRPVLGYGVCDGETFNGVVSTNAGGPHDYILQIMFWGGIIALAILPFMLITSVKASAKARNTDFYKCVVLGLIVMSIKLMVDCAYSDHFYMLLTLLAYSPEFVAGLESANVRRGRTGTGFREFDLGRIPSRR